MSSSADVMVVGNFDDPIGCWIQIDVTGQLPASVSFEWLVNFQLEQSGELYQRSNFETIQVQVGENPLVWRFGWGVDAGSVISSVEVNAGSIICIN